MASWQSWSVVDQFLAQTLDLERAAQLAPDAIFVLTARAYVYQTLGRSADALKDLNAAVTLGDFRGVTLVKRGMLREKQGDLEGAAEDYERTVATDTNIQIRERAAKQLKALRAKLAPPK